MRLKTLALSVALATTTAAPILVQAGAPELYGSIRYGFQSFEAQNTDGNDNVVSGTDRDTNFRNMSSRFGLKGETDVGNGLTGFGKIEFGTNGNDNGGDFVNGRDLYVGLKSKKLGEIKIGRTGHAFYNAVGATVDNCWWWSCAAGVGNFMSAGTSNDYSRYDGLTYSRDVGRFGVAVSYLPEGGSTGTDVQDDAYEIAATFKQKIASKELDLGVAYRDSDGLEDGVWGVSAQTKIGDARVGGVLAGQGDDTGFSLEAAYKKFAGGYGQSDIDATNTKPAGGWVAYTHSLGKGLSTWIEYGYEDKDNGGDTQNHLAGALKYDF